jgi:DNA-binding beta-propeller fold protein YncE
VLLRSGAAPNGLVCSFAGAILPTSLLLLLAACDGSANGKDSDSLTKSELRDEYSLPGDDSYPESVAWDTDTRSFYSSSLGRGDVTKIEADGTVSTFYGGDSSHPWVTVGLEVDSTRRRLWVCASVFDGSAAGELRVFDLDSGERTQSLSLGSARADASCTDVYLGPDGIGYVTDRENPDVYKVNAETGSAEILVEDVLLEAALVGLNGVAITPDGKNLLVTKYLDATLIRIPLEDPGSLSAVTLGGDPFEGQTGLSGADDIVFVGNTLYATLVDRLFTITPDDKNWSSASVVGVDLEEGGVTGLTVAEGSLYGANGHAVEYSLGMDPDTDFWIRRMKE